MTDMTQLINSNSDISSLYQYLKNWSSLIKKNSLCLTYIGDACRYYLAWKESIKKTYWDGPIEDQIPWMTYPAIKFIENNIDESDKVFEYGMGGSSLFFSRRAELVIAVEHDVQWFQSMQKMSIKMDLDNVELLLAQQEEELPFPKDDAGFDNFYSSNGSFYRGYVEAIDKYPQNYFDWVSVDGRARPSCIYKACDHVKPGKYLILDNSERKHYGIAIATCLHGWERMTFDGPTPYLKWFTQTSIWRKPT